MNPTDLAAPETSRQTWKFETPAGIDISTIVQALQALGCAFNPEEDQLGLGQDTGGYSLSSQRQSMKDALEEACSLENISLPENPPAWSELTPEQRQRVLDWFGESLQWADAGRLAEYPEVVTAEQEQGNLSRLLFVL